MTATVCTTVFVSLEGVIGFFSDSGVISPGLEGVLILSEHPKAAVLADQPPMELATICGRLDVPWRTVREYLQHLAEKQPHHISWATRVNASSYRRLQQLLAQSGRTADKTMPTNGAFNRTQAAKRVRRAYPDLVVYR